MRSADARSVPQGPQRWRLWAPPALWMALLFMASAMPGSGYPKVGLPLADKLVHFLAYVPLGAAFARAVAAGEVGRRRRHIAVATALCALFGVSDEIHQAFVPLRSPDARDLLADIVGGFAGAWAWTRVIAARGSFTAEAGGSSDART